MALDKTSGEGPNPYPVALRCGWIRWEFSDTPPPYSIYLTWAVRGGRVRRLCVAQPAFGGALHALVSDQHRVQAVVAEDADRALAASIPPHHFVSEGVGVVDAFRRHAAHGLQTAEISQLRCRERLLLTGFHVHTSSCSPVRLVPPMLPHQPPSCIDAYAEGPIRAWRPRGTMDGGARMLEWAGVFEGIGRRKGLG